MVCASHLLCPPTCSIVCVWGSITAEGLAGVADMPWAVLPPCVLLHRQYNLCTACVLSVAGRAAYASSVADWTVVVLRGISKPWLFPDSFLGTWVKLQMLQHLDIFTTNTVPQAASPMQLHHDNAWPKGYTAIQHWAIT